MTHRGVRSPLTGELDERQSLAHEMVYAPQRRHAVSSVSPSVHLRSVSLGLTLRVDDPRSPHDRIRAIPIFAEFPRAPQQGAYPTTNHRCPGTSSCQITIWTSVHAHFTEYDGRPLALA